MFSLNLRDEIVHAEDCKRTTPPEDKHRKSAFVPVEIFERVRFGAVTVPVNVGLAIALMYEYDAFQDVAVVPVIAIVVRIS